MDIRRSLCCLLTMLLSLSVFAQQPSPAPQNRPADDEVVRITTNLVQVDAVVTDKKGNIVTDLKPEEFEVLEDGKTQPITNFSYISLASGTRPTAPDGKAIAKADAMTPVPLAPLKREQVQRTLALVVDDLGLSFESIHFVRNALRKFVDEQVQPGDLVAIVRTAGGMGALQQFTNDKRQLYAAIDRVRWSTIGRGGIGAFAPIDSNSGASGNGNSAGDQDEDSGGVDEEDFRRAVFSVGTLGALGYVIRGLQTLPGRKAAVLFSDGIRITDLTGRGESGRTMDAMSRLIEQANRASVVIYTLDARGLVYTGPTAGDNLNGLRPDQVWGPGGVMSKRNDELFYGQEGLNFLARETGGISVRNSNDLTGGLRKIVEDQRGYYLIGYKPEASTFDQVTGRRKFHRISIKVRRPGLSVRTRSGFFGITEEKQGPVYKTMQQQMVAALTSPFGESGVSVRLTAIFGNDLKAGSFVRSMLHVKGSDLTYVDAPDGWKEAKFNILAIAFGDNGIPVEQVGRTETLRLKGGMLKRVQEGGFDYILTFPIKKAGAYQFRTAIRDEASQRLGSASQFVEVPDIKKNRLTLSGIIVQGIDPAKARQTPSGAAEINGKDRVENENDPESGPAVRRFKAGMDLQFGYLIYNAQRDKTTGKTQLLTQVSVFQDGKPVFNGKPASALITRELDPKHLVSGGGLSLGKGMAPGDYQLQVVVTDTLAKEKYRTATRWIDFEVTK